MKTSKNKYYHECPQCHCTLDPGERCEDCNPRERIPYPNSKNYKAVESLLIRKGMLKHVDNKSVEKT